jgi:epoxyqueuosine reductase
MPDSPTQWTAALQQWLDTEARAAGFDAVAIASADTPDVNAARYAAWVDSGFAAEMDYLKRRDEAGQLLRSSLRVAMPWARSIVICALNYNADAPRSTDGAPPTAAWIARYAWSGRSTESGQVLPTDYHDELLTRLHRIESALLERIPATTRCYVDTGPIAERGLAARAGLGWIGRNTCLIRQGTGSWLLLGVVVTSLELPAPLASLPAADRCGTCTRCIDACPTAALGPFPENATTQVTEAPRTMDASRCIAYLTIEKKGEIPEDLRQPIGRNVFGCDICQDVCPWNRRAPIATKPGAPGLDSETWVHRPELVNPALDWLAALDSREFKRLFKGSPLERTGRKRLLRNVAIAMANSADPTFLPQLEAWSAQTEDPDLRVTAAWAKKELEAVLSDGPTTRGAATS